VNGILAPVVVAIVFAAEWLASLARYSAGWLAFAR